mgnify:CR=1 FL=1
MFGLEKRHLDYILNTLKQNLSNGKFYVFGSRAKGTNKEYSDIDIAIKCGDEKISADVLGKLLITFTDSTLPYEVDIVDLNAIDEKFKTLIKDDLVELK